MNGVIKRWLCVIGNAIGITAQIFVLACNAPTNPIWVNLLTTIMMMGFVGILIWQSVDLYDWCVYWNDDDNAAENDYSHEYPISNAGVSAMSARDWDAWGEHMRARSDEYTYNPKTCRYTQKIQHKGVKRYLA